jgi:hypothetical protein
MEMIFDLLQIVSKLYLCFSYKIALVKIYLLKINVKCINENLKKFMTVIFCPLAKERLIRHDLW